MNSWNINFRDEISLNYFYFDEKILFINKKVLTSLIFKNC